MGFLLTVNSSYLPTISGSFERLDDAKDYADEIMCEDVFFETIGFPLQGFQDTELATLLNNGELIVEYPDTTIKIVYFPENV